MAAVCTASARVCRARPSGTTRSSRPAGSQAFEVHREEGSVVEPVDVPETVVEVEAVEDARPVVEAEDVVGDQVPVAVDDPVRAPGEQRAAPVEEAEREPPDGIELGAGQRRVPVRLHLVEVAPPPLPQGVAAAFRGDDRRPVGARVEGGEQPGDLPETVRQGVAPGEHRREPAVVGHASHDEDRLVAARAGQRGGAQVHVGREATVQLELAGDRRPPQVRGGEVAEGGAHRFLHLVGALTDQDDHVDVGLPDGGLGPGGRRHRASAGDSASGTATSTGQPANRIAVRVIEPSRCRCFRPGPTTSRPAEPESATTAS